MNRLLHIGFIWLGCAIAWVILGSTLVARSGESSRALLDEVHGLWGPELELRPPSGTYMVPDKVREKTRVRDAAGNETETEVEKEVMTGRTIRLDASDLHARLHLVQRQKGLLWFPTYDVELTGSYRFVNDGGTARRIDFVLPLPHDRTVFDGFAVLDEQGHALDVAIEPGAARWSAILGDGEQRSFHIDLRSRGTARFGYALTSGSGEARGFRLVVDTDCDDVDFPAGSLSPTTHGPHDAGWRGEWKFDRLIAGVPIVVELPQRINPGPLASRITFFAPVGLLFFFFVVAVRAAARKLDLHLINYFFIGCAFFAFHLLFAYLVDHVAILPALAISSVVSIFLVTSYARLFLPLRFVVVDMSIAQLLYLVLFSVTFLWKGYTGLSITIGAVATLFVMMQFTGTLPPQLSRGDHAAIPQL